MEVYTLDALLRRVDLIEDFESLIWTERYKQYGDFELHIASSFRTRSIFKVDVQLAMDMSNRVMKIDSVEDSVDDNNARMLVVKGRSLEAILYDRVAALSLTDTTTTPSWDIAGLTPTDAARKIFHDICVTGTLSAQDIIPFINEGTFAEASNIPESTDLVEVTIEPATVYDALVQLADSYDFGFRLLRRGDMSQIWFDIYVGADRTTGQTTLPAVVFSPQLDNLQNTTELSTTETVKNVAYVFSPAGFEMVYSPDVEPDVEGFERRVLIVNATDVTSDVYTTPTDVTNALVLRGNAELAKLKPIQSLDGEISQNSQYKPGRDYYCGDLVEVRNDDGVSNRMRATEIIFASDNEGERAYPTLTLNEFIPAGAWFSSLYNKTWLEWDAETVIPDWADQP